MENRPGREIDRDSGEPDAEHPATEHVGRVSHAAERLDEDPDREHDERDAVGERDQHLGPLEPVRPPGRRGPPGQPHGTERKRQRNVVGQHVGGVGEQRETPGEQSADDLDDRVGRGQRERERQSTRRSFAFAVVVVRPHDLGSTGPAERPLSATARSAAASRS